MASYGCQSAVIMRMNDNKYDWVGSIFVSSRIKLRFRQKTPKRLCTKQQTQSNICCRNTKALDSIRIFQPVTTITKTITNTEVQYKTRRWGIGVQVGIGVTPNKIEPYVGIGVNYNILTW